MEKAIYLHKNGTLHVKPEIVYKNDPSYFDSPFVVKVWYIKATDGKEKIQSIKQDMLRMGLTVQEVESVFKDIAL